MREELNERVTSALTSRPLSAHEIAADLNMASSRDKTTLKKHLDWMVQRGDVAVDYRLGSRVYALA